MQRPTRTSRTSDEPYIIDVMDQLEANQHPTRKKKKSEGFSDPRRFRRAKSQSRSSRRLIHALMIGLVLLFILILGFTFYHPVNLKVKDGRITSDHKIEMLQPLNDTHIGSTIPALANPRNALIHPTLAPNNDTEVQSVSEID